jgi:hypothetical protein
MAKIDAASGGPPGEHLCTKYQAEHFCFSTGKPGEDLVVGMDSAGAEQLHLTAEEVKEENTPPVLKLRGETNDVVYHALSNGDTFLEYYRDPGASCAHRAFGIKLKIPDVRVQINKLNGGLHTLTYTCDDPDDNRLSAVPVTRTVITEKQQTPAEA